jgi:MFS family permease
MRGGGGTALDRIGVRRPMLVGSIALAIGSGTALVPGFTALFISAAVVGVAFMLFQVPAQNATGEWASRASCTQLQPAGARLFDFRLWVRSSRMTIDHGGFAAAFAVLAVLPLIPAAVLAGGRLGLPGPHPAREHGKIGSVLELVTHKELRRVFFVNVLLAMGWDLHTIVIPVYGASIGLSASQIGLILASFAAATFVVRFSMRWIVRRFSEHQVLTIAMVVAGIVYLLFPFSHSAPTLMALSFSLGLGLGMSQPMVMSLLHSHAPPGRMGEAAGVRMSLVQSMSVAVPLAFGALGATIGLTPVFWSVGVCLGMGGWLTKRAA